MDTYEAPIAQSIPGSARHFIYFKSQHVTVVTTFYQITNQFQLASLYLTIFYRYIHTSHIPYSVSAYCNNNGSTHFARTLTAKKVLFYKRYKIRADLITSFIHKIFDETLSNVKARLPFRPITNLINILIQIQKFNHKSLKEIRIFFYIRLCCDMLTFKVNK